MCALQLKDISSDRYVSFFTARHSSPEDLSGESSEETELSAFSFSFVQPFVKAVKNAIGWEDPGKPHQKSKTYFPFLKRNKLPSN